MSKRNSNQLSAALIILSLLFSQLGLNLMHSHQGFAKESATAYSAPSSGATPCKACAVDGVPTLYVEEFQLITSETFAVEFAGEMSVAELHAATSSSFGRAPPVR